MKEAAALPAMTPQKPSRSLVQLDVDGVGSGDRLVVTTSRPSLFMTLEASIVDVSAVGVGRFVVERTSCLVVPRKTTLRCESKTPANRFAVLGFDVALFQEVERHHRKIGVDARRLEGWLARATALPRTIWVHEIVHRYVFERHGLGLSRSLAARFLEVEILKEIFFLFRDREAGADRASAAQRYSAPVERAVATMESHLFEPFGMAELARRVGASESTLLRCFHRELGVTPGEYWRTRRLDEALVLARAGGWSVAEIAARVGYDNPTSFAHAFRLRFGRPPVEFLRKTRTRRAPR
ncbi:MAG: helix-turn-helix transcriptional regulator [Deltaproteobacteria bacterium]|nr:helix-turn-helix transcriptional regulator [Deltaproteobacteria bacterium]